MIKSIKEAIADKGKAAANKRAGAFCILRCVLEKVGPAAESFIVPLLADAVEGLADKAKPVSIEADKLAKAIINGLSPHGVKVCTDPGTAQECACASNSRP